MEPKPLSIGWNERLAAWNLHRISAAGLEKASASHDLSVSGVTFGALLPASHGPWWLWTASSVFLEQLWPQYGLDSWDPGVVDLRADQKELDVLLRKEEEGSCALQLVVIEAIPKITECALVRIRFGCER